MTSDKQKQKRGRKPRPKLTLETMTEAERAEHFERVEYDLIRRREADPLYCRFNW